MTGRPDYDVGDLVECVDASPCRCCGVHTPYALHAVYEVEEIIQGFSLVSRAVIPAVILAGIGGVGGHPRFMGHNASRFRKVRSLPESLTSLLSTDTPLRVKEDA